MKTYSFPYDYKSVDVSIDERFVQGVLVSNAAAYKAEKCPAELVEDALDHPINSPSLEELVKGKRNMVIITSDHTRPMPSKVTCSRTDKYSLKAFFLHKFVNLN